MSSRSRLPNGLKEKLPYEPYNPVSPKNLAKSIVTRLLTEQPRRLPPETPFAGAGVYVLYYACNRAGFKPYGRVNNHGKPFEHWIPIYVGRASEPGSRTGGDGEESEFDYVPNINLYNRLREHTGSLAAVKNLSVTDFCYRALVLEQVWIGLGETLLIRKYRPLWNQVISGFGIHPQGGGRDKQKKSEWDTIHPGRDRQAEPNKSSKASLRREICHHLDNLGDDSPGTHSE